MTPGEDLAASAVEPVLGGRPVRSYPALLSTHADALAWARSGGPHGAVVVADYQVSPRGRAGLEWRVTPGRGLGFSLVVRPLLSAEQEGWLYIAGCTGLADVVGDHGRTRWPDEVDVDGVVVARLGVHAELGPSGVAWAVLTVLVEDAEPPRAALLARAVAAIEARIAEDRDVVLDGYRQRCATLGRRVRARMIPMGPAGDEIVGEAVGCNPDGALVVRTDAGRRVGVRPQHLGLLEPADGDR